MIYLCLQDAKAAEQGKPYEAKVEAIWTHCGEPLESRKPISTHHQTNPKEDAWHEITCLPRCLDSVLVYLGARIGKVEVIVGMFTGSYRGISTIPTHWSVQLKDSRAELWVVSLRWWGRNFEDTQLVQFTLSHDKDAGRDILTNWKPIRDDLCTVGSVEVWFGLEGFVEASLEISAEDYKKLAPEITITDHDA